MNRDELDAFFAKAEDVLTDWPGSMDALDAMHAQGADQDDYLLPPPVDSYYDTIATARMIETAAAIYRSAEAARSSLLAMGEALVRVRASLRELRYPAPHVRKQEPPIINGWTRAIDARRTRNTGPTDRRGLDGRTRR